MNRILYLHGFASSPASSKARFFHDFLTAAGFTVDTPDLAEGDFDHLTLSRQLRAIEAAAQGAPVTLIGSSMGGYLATLYAARHPEVDRLVLMAPAFGFAQRWAEHLGPDRIAEWRRSGWLDVFHYGDNRTRRVHYDLLADAEQYEPYPAVTQPTLIFHGEHDDVVPVDYARRFSAEHPDARLHVCDSGHDLLNVLDFMRDQVTAFLLGS